MNIKKLLTYGFVVPFLIACQQEMVPTLTDGVGEVPPLVESADGTLYSPSCIQSRGFERMSECAIDFDRFDEVRGMSRSQRRGFHNSWWWDYYSYYNNWGMNNGWNWGNGYYGYPYYNLNWYQPGNWCGQFGWGSNCYSWFGYDNWNNWPQYTYCGSTNSNAADCYYTNNPTNPFNNNQNHNNCSSSSYTCY